MSVDDLLRQYPALWRARESGGPGSAPPGLPTGFTALDRSLPGGGWPQQGLIEILTDRHGIGELSLLMPALATLCRGHEVAGAGGWLAWVAPPYQPYAPALAAAGIDVRRVLVVRGASPPEWAMEQALRSEACSAVLGWSNPRALTALRRLQLAAEQARCLAVLFRPTQAGEQPSPAILRLELQGSPSGLQVRVVKSRGGRPVTVQLGHLGAPWQLEPPRLQRAPAAH
jgi:hypothetical protein